MRANPLLPTQLFRVAKDIDSRESEKWLKRVSRESSNSPCPTSYSMEFSRSLGFRVDNVDDIDDVDDVADVDADADDVDDVDVHDDDDDDDDGDGDDGDDDDDNVTFNAQVAKLCVAR